MKGFLIPHQKVPTHKLKTTAVNEEQLNVKAHTINYKNPYVMGWAGLENIMIRKNPTPKDHMLYENHINSWSRTDKPRETESRLVTNIRV